MVKIIIFKIFIDRPASKQLPSKTVTDFLWLLTVLMDTLLYHYDHTLHRTNWSQQKRCFENKYKLRVKPSQNVFRRSGLRVCFQMLWCYCLCWSNLTVVTYNVKWQIFVSLVIFVLSMVFWFQQLYFNTIVEIVKKCLGPHNFVSCLSFLIYRYIQWFSKALGRAL